MSREWFRFGRIGWVLAVAVGLLVVVQVAVAEQSVARFAARVAVVVDGDSLEVARDGGVLRLRLHGVDCPEWDQPYGREAREFSEGLAAGELISVVVTDQDEYGRSVAEVFLSDGRSLNRELVRSGFAWWYRRYSDDPELERLEQQARQARRGLWQAPDPVPPWRWRRGGRPAAVDALRIRGPMVEPPKGRIDTSGGSSVHED